MSECMSVIIVRVIVLHVIVLHVIVLSVIMPSFIMLSVIILSVILLGVTALLKNDTKNLNYFIFSIDIGHQLTKWISIEKFQRTFHILLKDTSSKESGSIFKTLYFICKL